MMTGKGQAALEFLTTYGWAILALTIAIGSLTYFGALNPSDWFPERCNFSPDIICDDWQLKSDGYEVNLQLRHNIGEQIILENVTCMYPRGGVDFTDNFNENWNPKEKKTVTCNPASGTDLLIEGEKEKVGIVIAYRLDTGGYIHYAEGEVYAEVI